MAGLKPAPTKFFAAEAEQELRDRRVEGLLPGGGEKGLRHPGKPALHRRAPRARELPAAGCRYG